MSTETDRKDPQITQAYDRLGRSLEAPVDVLARVEQRMRARRAGRTRAVGAAAVLGLVGATGVAGAALSRGDDPTGVHVSDQPSAPVNTLGFTRSDGSTYTFQDVEVTCKKYPEYDKQMIIARSPLRTEGDTLLEPYLDFEASVDEVAGGRTFELPSPDVETGKQPMILFFATDEGGPRANELSSQESSTGTVEVTGASCGPVPSLDLVVDAKLGSEVEQPAMRLAGELHVG
jgi:hypothetical protein